MLAAISGRSSVSAPTAIARAATMPAMAAAALPSTSREIRLIPATSTTEYMTQTSLAPTYGDTSPDAMVDTRSLGSPTGRPAMTCAAIDEPPEPPAASTPPTRPPATRSATTAAAPRPIAVAGAGVDHDHLGAGRAQPAGQEREVLALGVQGPDQCDGCHAPLRYR